MNVSKNVGPPKLKEFNCEKVSDDLYKLNVEVENSKSASNTKKYSIEMNNSNLDAVLNELNKIKSIYIETHKKKETTSN